MTERELLTVRDRVFLFAAAISNDRNPYPAVRLHLPGTMASWLIAASLIEDPDRLYALCDSGAGRPWLGYVTLAELKAIRGPNGRFVERDALFVATKRISTYAVEAHANGRITS